jgi:hypothetical protein
LSVLRQHWRGLPLGEWLLLAAVIVLGSWQVMLRSEDPSGIQLELTQRLFNREGGDLAQYRPLSHYIVLGVRWVMMQLKLVGETGIQPYWVTRFFQCVVVFGLSYVYFGQLGIAHRLRLLGIGLLAGIMSLSLGTQGVSSFSLDRFTDTAFYLGAAVLVLSGRFWWIPPLMVLAVANRETSVMIPLLIVAYYWRDLFRRPLLTSPAAASVLAWVIGAGVYLAIHAYYGNQARHEASYFGPDMLLFSIKLAATGAYFFAAVSLLPALALICLRTVDPFLVRSFWLIVPAWFALHMWAARLGEGLLYFAAINVVLVPLILQGLQRLALRQPRPAIVPAAA